MSNNPPITLTCPLCTQQVSDLDIRCPNCNRFLFRFTKFASSTFIVTALAALVMFRISGAIWPMYLLIGLGILHLYAVIFSKGEVLSSAATIFLGITLAWGAWLTISWLSGLEAFHGLLPTWVRMQELLHTFLVWILLGIWLLGIFWSINLGRWKSMPGIKLASSYFLGMGAFIFGLWGIWAILIQNALAQEQIFQLTTVLALLVPLVLLLGLLVRQPPVGTLTRGEVVAIWCLLFGAYLTSTDFLTTLVQFGLGKFLPKLLGASPTTVISLPLLLQVLRWRLPLSGLLAFTAIVSLAGASVVQAYNSSQIVQASFAHAARQRVVTSNSQTQSDLERLMLSIMGAVLELIILIMNIAILAGHTMVRFVDNLITTIRRAFRYVWQMIRYLVIPVVSFSILSILLIMILSHYQAYLGEVPTFDPKALWGEALIVLLLIVILCGASFGFAPAVPGRFVFAGTEAALLGIYAYLFISLASIGLWTIWVGFSAVGINFSGTQPGPVYQLNLSVTLVSLLLLALTVAPQNLINSLRNRFPRTNGIIQGFQISILVIIGIMIVLFGLGLMLQSLAAATR